MSLVTVQRSPTNSSNSSTISVSDNDEDEVDDKRQKKISVSESFFAVKGAALVLPHSSEIRLIKKHPVIGELQFHLQSMFCLLRSKDSIKLAVRLESFHEGRLRYMVLVSSMGREDTEENIILGIDIGDNGATIGLVQAIFTTTYIDLDGDGGFSVTNPKGTHIYKPVSVQAMWSAFQALHRASLRARRNNYIPDGLNHSWMGFYKSNVRSNQSCINEWEYIKDIVVVRPDNHTILSFVKEIYAGLYRPSQKDIIQRLIRVKLKEIMMEVDLEEITSREIRLKLEDRMDKDLKEYKGFIDEQMLIILGQIDAPSLIFDYLYLGSEWNASNLDELEDNQIGYILNITKEIDNFFPSTIKYHNVREYDIESTYLLKYWDDTFKFIKSAKMAGSKILVHCKMGVSRSASTVIAYIMKEYKWPMQQAFDYVKMKRRCIKPNSAFMNQLVEYQGILDASNQRHNLLFRSKSESSLSACSSEAHENSEIFSSTEDLLLTPDTNLTHRSKSWCNRKDFVAQDSSLDIRQTVPSEEVINFQVPTAESDSSSETLSLDETHKTNEGFTTGNRLSVGEVVKQIELKGSESDSLTCKQRPNSFGDNLVTVSEKNVLSQPTPDVFSPEDVIGTSIVPGDDVTNNCDTGDVQLNAAKKYELESIPWNPGTVLKQKQDIEERLKDVAVKESSPPVVRSERMSRPGSEDIKELSDNKNSETSLTGEVKRMSSELERLKVEDGNCKDVCITPAIIVQSGDSEGNLGKVETKDAQSLASNSPDHPPSKVLSPTICGLEPGIVKKKTERFSSIIDGIEDSTVNEKMKEATTAERNNVEENKDTSPMIQICSENEVTETNHSKKEEQNSEQRLSKVIGTGEIVPLPEGTVRRHTKDYEQLLSEADKTLLDQAGSKETNKKGSLEIKLTPVEVNEIRDLGKIMLCREPSEEDNSPPEHNRNFENQEEFVEVNKRVRQLELSASSQKQNLTKATLEKLKPESKDVIGCHVGVSIGRDFDDDSDDSDYTSSVEGVYQLQDSDDASDNDEVSHGSHKPNVEDDVTDRHTDDTDSLPRGHTRTHQDLDNNCDDEFSPKRTKISESDKDKEVSSLVQCSLPVSTMPLGYGQQRPWKNTMQAKGRGTRATATAVRNARPRVTSSSNPTEGTTNQRSNPFYNTM